MPSNASWSPVYATSEQASSEGENSLLSTQTDTLHHSSANSSQNESTMSSSHGPLSSSDTLQYSGELGHSTKSGVGYADVSIRRLIGAKSNLQLMQSSGLIPATIAENESESKMGSKVSIDKLLVGDNNFDRHPLPAQPNIQLIKGAVSVANLPPATASQVLNIKKTQSTTDVSVGRGRARNTSRTNVGSGGRVKLKPLQPKTVGREGGAKEPSAVGRGYSKVVSTGVLEEKKVTTGDAKRRASDGLVHDGAKGVQK